MRQPPDRAAAGRLNLHQVARIKLIGPDTTDLAYIVLACQHLAQMRWSVALLAVLADGPLDRDSAASAVLAWADKPTDIIDVDQELAALVQAGLVVCLQGIENAGYVATEAGRNILDLLDGLSRRTRLLAELGALADSCLLVARIARLSGTEQRVLRLVAQGHTDPQVADTLAMSRDAVETHVSTILRQLAMPSRNALIARLAVEDINP